MVQVLSTILTSGGVLVFPVIQPAGVELRVDARTPRLELAKLGKVSGRVCTHPEVDGGKEGLRSRERAAFVSTRSVCCKIYNIWSWLQCMLLRFSLLSQ